MATTLTTAAVAKLKPGRKPREVLDGGSRSLFLVIYPSGAKSWIVRRKKDGKRYKGTLGTCDTSGKELVGEPTIGGHLTLAAARRLTAEVHRQWALGRDLFAERRTAKMAAVPSTTFAAAAREYFEQYQRTERGNRTWRKQARVFGLLFDGTVSEPSIISGSLADRWRDKPVASITDFDVFRAIDEAYRNGVPGRPMRTEGPLLSRKREMAKYISGFLSWLHDRRLIDAATLDGITKVEPSKSRDRVLSDSELKALWRALDDNVLARVIKIMIMTGARRGEVMAMTWAEIDGDMWTLPAARSKNKRAHQVPLSQQVKDLLPTEVKGSKYVFSTDGGKTYAQAYGKLKYRLDAKLKFAAPWRFHDIRRTVVTGMVEIGIQPHVVEAAVNHISGHKGGVAGVYNKAEYAEPVVISGTSAVRSISGNSMSWPGSDASIGQPRSAARRP